MTIQQIQWKRGRMIGRGSTATVFLASLHSSDHLFAVKSAELSRSALLQREHSILSSLAPHPNIISYSGFDISSDFTAIPDCSPLFYYNLFLEYAPAGSLLNHISVSGCSLKENDIRLFTRDILSGLTYLHDNSIAHCDIKAQNILIATDGHAKIADLGCARSTFAVDNAKDMNRMGTPMFMAPEVARGEEQGEAADIWALGCTIIQMATGRDPWPDIVDPIAALHQIGFSTHVPECPSFMSNEAHDFLQKCLNRDSKERWTAKKLLEHPFVATTTETDSGVHEKPIWISPTSVLQVENFCYDSEAEQEEVDGYKPATAAVERVRQLARDYTPTMISNDDDNWITVRSSSNNREQLNDVVLIASDSFSNTNNTLSILEDELSYSLSGFSILAQQFQVHDGFSNNEDGDDEMHEQRQLLCKIVNCGNNMLNSVHSVELAINMNKQEIQALLCSCLFNFICLANVCQLCSFAQINQLIRMPIQHKEPFTLLSKGTNF